VALVAEQSPSAVRPLDHLVRAADVHAALAESDPVESLPSASGSPGTPADPPALAGAAKPKRTRKAVS
jgi:hypothetical protein